jgi:hypothetical protein
VAGEFSVSASVMAQLQARLLAAEESTAAAAGLMGQTEFARASSGLAYGAFGDAARFGLDSLRAQLAEHSAGLRASAKGVESALRAAAEQECATVTAFAAARAELDERGMVL